MCRYFVVDFYIEDIYIYSLHTLYCGDYIIHVFVYQVYNIQRVQCTRAQLNVRRVQVTLTDYLYISVRVLVCPCMYA